jgi:hypothetical protein
MHNLISFVGQGDCDILGPFLDHYRKLGIDAFHIFIHGDWTQTDLGPLRAADVTIAGVVQAAFEGAAKSAAIEAYAEGLDAEWLIVVDADEFLELPYATLKETIGALDLIGLDELPCVILPRASADGSLPALAAGVSLDTLFPCYDYRLADRMGPGLPTSKSRYPLMRLGAQFAPSGRHHQPSSGRPSAHIPIRGVLHHFKWRDGLLSSRSGASRAGPERRRQEDAYRFWLEQHDFRLPTTGLKPCGRPALFAAGHLVRPTRSEMSRLVALHTARQLPAADMKTENMPAALRSLPSAAEQTPVTDPMPSTFRATRRALGFGSPRRRRWAPR